MIEKETGTLEDPRFKFTTEPRHFTFMGRPHVAHYPKCTTKIFKICSTPMSHLVSKMVKNDTARKIEQFCRHTGQINVYTYLVMSIHFCTFVVEKEIYRTF